MKKGFIGLLGLGLVIAATQAFAAAAGGVGLVVKERYEAPDPFGVIEEFLLGTMDTRIYHYTWCPLANKHQPGKYEMFNTVQHAKMDGYKPCNVCRPPTRLGY